MKNTLAYRRKQKRLREKAEKEIREWESKKLMNDVINSLIAYLEFHRP